MRTGDGQVLCIFKMWDRGLSKKRAGLNTGTRVLCVCVCLCLCIGRPLGAESTDNDCSHTLTSPERGQWLNALNTPCRRAPCAPYVMVTVDAGGAIRVPSAQTTIFIASTVLVILVIVDMAPVFQTCRPGPATAVSQLQPRANTPALLMRKMKRSFSTTFASHFSPTLSTEPTNRTHAKLFQKFALWPTSFASLPPSSAATSFAAPVFSRMPPVSGQPKMLTRPRPLPPSSRPQCRTLTCMP